MNGMTMSHDEQAIRKLGREWDAAIAAKDLDRVVGFFAADARSLADNTPPAVGLAEIRELWGNVLALPGLVFTTQDEVVQVSASRDLAYVIGKAKFGFDTEQGRIEDDSKYLLVWKNVAGVWKLAADMNNSNVPLEA